MKTPFALITVMLATITLAGCDGPGTVDSRCDGPNRVYHENGNGSIAVVKDDPRCTDSGG